MGSPCRAAVTGPRLAESLKPIVRTTTGIHHDLTHITSALHRNHALRRRCSSGRVLAEVRTYATRIDHPPTCTRGQPGASTLRDDCACFQSSHA